jgi:WS/DGAT/MGAT family acyltransferase
MYLQAKVGVMVAPMNRSKHPDEPMAPVDLAWWRMEQGEGTATVGGALSFESRLSRSSLCKLVTSRILETYPRFRRRVIDTGADKGPRWAEDDDFALDYHIHEVEFDASGDSEGIRELAGELMSRGLDKQRPPWRMWLVQRPGEGSTLLILFHHCLGDGFALARALLQAADGTLGVGEDAAGEDDPGGGLLAPVMQMWKRRDEVVERARQLGRWLEDVVHLLMLPFERRTSLSNPLTGRLRVDWSQRVPLGLIKDIGREYGGTVNDVLLTAVAGAVRTHLSDQGEKVDEFDLRCIVPVNLRAARRVEEMATDLGNRFGLVFLELPIHASGPAERMAALQEEIRRLKKSGEPAVSFGILWMLGHLPPIVERIFNAVFGRKASMVVSNVPGPSRALTMDGVALSNLMFWVPHPAGLGLGISLISYNDGVCIGVRSDTGVLEEPGTLVEGIEAELRTMHRSGEETSGSHHEG